MAPNPDLEIEWGRKMDNPGETFAYLFEAKGIQPYIFGSGRLRDVIAASDLLAIVAGSEGDLVSAVKARGFDGIEFSRRAGAAFCAHFHKREDREGFRALWRLTLAAALPGLEFVEARAEGSDDGAVLKAVYQAGADIRENTAASVLPLGGPATAFAPRTGRPSVVIDGARGEPVDQILAPVRLRSEGLPAPAIGPDGAVTPHYGALARRVLPQRFIANPASPERVHDDEGSLPLLLPRNLASDEDDTLGNPLFPFVGDLDRVALVHADLSGLGQFYMTAGEGRSLADRLALSKEIEGVVLGAIRKAVEDRLIPYADLALYEGRGRQAYAWERVAMENGEPANVRLAPFRAIVAGGDDITFLVRSDLALSFTAALLAEIERLSGERNLSACAGVAFVKATTPFMVSHHLAEELCSFAKGRAKSVVDNQPPYPSALAFHTPSGTIAEDFDGQILGHQLTTPAGRVTAGIYWSGELRPQLGAAHIDRLLDLATTVAKLRGRGGLRELQGAMQAGEGAALGVWRRWREVQRSRQPKALEALDRALSEAGVSKPASDFRATYHDHMATTLFDALTLAELTAGRDGWPEGDGATEEAA